jgi:predicted adenylyl cyclase CyaB
MQNLELKAYSSKSDNESNKQKFLDMNLKFQILSQKDTYFKTTKGRLKMREQKDLTAQTSRAYAIFYERPDTEESKISNYDFYNINDPDMFIKVFGGALEKEIIVDKIRTVYFYQNARIHFDDVDGLGSFVEIEVVINNFDEEKNSNNVMNDLINILNIKGEHRIKVGYRELLTQRLEIK